MPSGVIRYWSILQLLMPLCLSTKAPPLTIQTQTSLKEWLGLLQKRTQISDVNLPSRIRLKAQQFLKMISSYEAVFKYIKYWHSSVQWSSLFPNLYLRIRIFARTKLRKCFNKQYRSSHLSLWWIFTLPENSKIHSQKFVYYDAYGMITSVKYASVSRNSFLLTCCSQIAYIRIE